MAKNITVEDTLEADWAVLCRSGSFQADPLQPGQQCGQVHTQRGPDRQSIVIKMKIRFAYR